MNEINYRLEEGRKTVAYMNAITRMNALSIHLEDQAEMIELGGTAWAYGIKPELLEALGSSIATRRITPEYIARLGEAVTANQTERKPWHDAEPGEIWALDVHDEEILCRTTDDGDFTPIFGHHYWATFANGTNKITDARRIWPETSDDK